MSEAPKKIRLPHKGEECEMGHPLTHQNGALVDDISFDRNGEPVCGSCEDHKQALLHSELPKGKDGKPETVCPNGHKATLENRKMVAEVKDNQVVGIKFVCTDCEKPIKKAYYVTNPDGKRVRVRGGKFDLGAPIAQHDDTGNVHLTAVHMPTGEVRNLSDVLPGDSEYSYVRRSKAAGRHSTNELPLPTVLDRTNQNPNHGIKDGDTVGVDHVVPIRGGGFHHDLNAIIKPLKDNRELQDTMPTVDEIKQMGPGYAHLIPYVRALNPLGVAGWKARTSGAVSVGLPKTEYRNSDLGLEGHARSGVFTKGEFTHYGIPGFKQHTMQEFDSEGNRHENVASWLNAVQDRYGKIPDFDAKTDPVFDIKQRKDGKGKIGFLNPNVRNHLLRGMEREYETEGHSPEVKKFFRRQARLMLSQSNTVLTPVLLKAARILH